MIAKRMLTTPERWRPAQLYDHYVFIFGGNRAGMQISRQKLGIDTMSF